MLPLEMPAVPSSRSRNFFKGWPLSLSAVRWRRARPGPRRGLAPMSLGGLYGPLGRETIVRGSAALRSTGDCGRARALVAAVVVLHGWMAVGAHAVGQPRARSTGGRGRARTLCVSRGLEELLAVGNVVRRCYGWRSVSKGGCWRCCEKVTACAPCEGGCWRCCEKVLRLALRTACAPCEGGCWRCCEKVLRFALCVGVRLLEML